MTDILQELRGPIPKVMGYNGEYIDERDIRQFFNEAANEIERLRRALRSILQFDADYKAENDGKWHSGGVPWAVMCIARAALEEKE